jgi:hypothetical protein
MNLYCTRSRYMTRPKNDSTQQMTTTIPHCWLLAAAAAAAAAAACSQAGWILSCTEPLQQWLNIQPPRKMAVPPTDTTAVLDLVCWQSRVDTYCFTVLWLISPVSTVFAATGHTVLLTGRCVYVCRAHYLHLGHCVAAHRLLQAAARQHNTQQVQAERDDISSRTRNKPLGQAVPGSEPGAGAVRGVNYGLLTRGAAAVRCDAMHGMGAACARRMSKSEVRKPKSEVRSRSRDSICKVLSIDPVRAS